MSERQKRKLAQREANRLKKRMIEKVLATTKTTNYAPNLNCLVDGWLELESDPATFSLLIEDFGCFGAQVEEIYDLDQKFEGPIFGFIFLFKWLNNHQSDSTRSARNHYQKSTYSNTNNGQDQTMDDPQQSSSSSSGANGQNSNGGQPWSYVKDEEKINRMFFAKQMISNSCATHALISILLNCSHDELNLGPTLTKLKEHTKFMDPECRGYAIGNLPDIAKAHNSHASFSSLYNRNKPSHLAGMSYMISGNQRTNLQQQKKHEAYHFVSYVPIKNRLYELDGLKNYPIDHGPLDPKKDWTEKFKEIIKQRLANRSGDDPTVSNDIRYNLMAVVPDKRCCLRSRLKILRHQRELVNGSMVQMTARAKPAPIEIDIPNPPYSPLSNATLTASESGSPPHSSSSHEPNGYISDDDSKKIDKYFFIKFDSKHDSTQSREENIEPAHKSCIIKVEPTPLSPLNFKIGATTKCKTDQVQDKDCETKVKQEEDTEMATNEEKQAPPIDKDEPKPEETRENGIAETESDEDKLNETPAHNNEKLYNLSTKPPFEFNILDDLQHVHSDKSTLRDLTSLSNRLRIEIESVEATLRDEIEKRRKYKVDNSRRTHNYEPFIMTFLSMLASHGKLADLIERDLGIISEDTNSVQQPTPIAAPKTPAKSPTKTPAKEVSPPKSPEKSRYRYVSTGRPVGRPRKNPLTGTPTHNKTDDA